MKKTILAFSMLFLTGLSSMAQTPKTEKNKPFQYYVFINNIPFDWNFPLIGFFNHVDGNNTSLQLGIINITTGYFAGVQVGFINSIGKNVNGIQCGFINNSGGYFRGIENGFINTVDDNFYGIQNGFINSVDKSVYGIQNGFINSVDESVYGIQNGYINSTNKKIVGAQLGFINSAGNIYGLQLGFINSTNTLHGLQLGFINSVDRLDKGLPIGFLSLVKHGGYKALDFSYNNIYPFNIAFKTGVRALYTYPMLAYDGRLDNDRFAFGYGIGTISDFNSHIFINPEIEWLQQVSADFNHYSTLRCNIGYKVGDNFEILAGPSLVWHFKINADDYHHNYSEWDPDLPEVNKIRVGYNLAIRYRL